MDFAKMMSAQISKSSSAQPATTKAAPAKPTSAAFQRRGEVEAAREAAYRAEQAAMENARIVKAEKKRQREEHEAEQEHEREAKKRRLAVESRKRQAEEDAIVAKKRRRKLGLPELPNAQGDGTDQGDAVTPETNSAAPVLEINEDDLRIRLRKTGEPTALFGEDHAQRSRRFQHLTAKTDQSSQSPSSSSTAVSDPSQPIPTSLAKLSDPDATRISSPIPPPEDSAGRLHLACQLGTWFNLVLSEWAAALASRDPSTASTFAGRAASNSYTQAISHLQPLFRKLEKLSTDPTVLPADLLAPTCSIIRLAQERRYVDANDGYLQLSIGKAAWPIGVTMVGIHERSAREKIGESGGAHILSDEMTRKWLQSVKRCLSFAQTRWPPEDAGQLMG